jgi:hypothetical protein
VGRRACQAVFVRGAPRGLRHDQPRGTCGRAGTTRCDRPGRAGYSGQAGHVPDTTWTGEPEPYTWLDLTPRVNASLGGQAVHYPIGYRPTGFEFME